MTNADELVIPSNMKRPRNAKRGNSQTDRRVIVVLSDTHAGHKLGLMPPDVTLYEEDERGNPVPYTPRQTASQAYLWRIYNEYLTRSIEIADGAPIIVIHNGDLTQGIKHKEQLVTTSIGNQILISVANLLPWLRYPNVKVMRIVQGTQSHEFMESTAPMLVTNALAQVSQECDVRMLNHGLLTVGGVTIDYAHHGPGPGGREWLRGNEARFYLRNLMMQEIARGEKPPRLVLRGHVHTYTKEVLEWGGHESTLIITPAYCMLGDYARQAVKSPHLIGNGHVVIEVECGEVLRTHKLVSTVDMRTREDVLP